MAEPISADDQLAQEAALHGLRAPPSEPFGRAAARGLRRFIRAKPLGAFGGLIVVVMLILAIAPGVFAPEDPVALNVSERLEAPSWSHWLGTDATGRDMLSRLIYGARVSMTVGFGAVGVATVIAVVLGALSAYYGGWRDLMLQRGIDVAQSLPALIILIVLLSVEQPFGQGVGQLIFVIGLLFGIGSSRVVRSVVLAIKQNVYVEAARTIGAGDMRIIARHILPNAFAPVMVIMTVQLGAAILVESTASFLGLGIAPPTVTWGRELSGTGRAFFVQNPWMAVFPGVFIAATVFGFNMLGDALRDVLDPRLRRA